MMVKMKDLLKDRKKQAQIIKYVNEGKIFIYPTDTVYGLGCDATNRDSVRKIKEMKKSSHPLSVIAPSKEWIIKNLVVDDVGYLLGFPGPFTLVFRKTDMMYLDEASDLPTLGVRVPKSPFTDIIQKAGKPFITTSVNISGRKPATKISEMPKEIKDKVDVIIDAGTISNPPSTIIDYSTGKPRIVRR